MINDLMTLLTEKPEVANAVGAIAGALVATAACIISLGSLYVSSRSLTNQLKHNQLSVRPLAYVTLGNYENHLFVKVRNNGTGPMIVKSINCIGADDPTVSLLRCMPPIPPQLSWTDYVEAVRDRSTPPGGEIILLELSEESQTPLGLQYFESYKNSMRQTLGKLTLEVLYTDIYEDEIYKAQRKLDWFTNSCS